MTDLITAAQQHIERATLVGWTLGKRRQIVVIGGAAHLHLSYRNNAGLSSVQAGDDLTIDARDLPCGVTVQSWEAPPDDIIQIDPPTDDEVMALARHLGCSHVDKGHRADGATIYYLI